MTAADRTRALAYKTIDDALSELHQDDEIDTAEAVRIAVGALLAAGWRPPASDDVKAHAAAVLGHETGLGTVAAARVCEALGDAGLLGSSPLDQLAAWADEHDAMAAITRSPAGARHWVASVGGSGMHDDSDAQEAARRVLAQLEKSRA